LLYKPEIQVHITSQDREIPHHEVFLQTRDGVTISTWYVPAKESVGIVLLCHGNAGNISQRIDSYKIFQELGLSVFIFDYRGYGGSQGRPSEKGTYLDAERAWEYLVRELGIKSEKIISLGRSLGGGVASYLARQYSCRGLIIESSFTSIPDMARRMFPYVPVKWLIRYRYNTLERLKYIYCPLMVVQSPYDELIPFSHGLRLFAAANEPKTFLKIRGNHQLGFVQSGSTYIEGLRDFIAGLAEISKETRQILEEKGITGTTTKI